MLRPLRADIPIYLAAIGPKNVALAAEIADGWLPIFVVPERFDDAFGPSIAGAREGFEIARDRQRPRRRRRRRPARRAEADIALYVGGMGAKGKNFYNALVSRYGWEAEAERIQELYLGGKQREAIAAVPDELVDALALVGPKERIRDRLEAWRETPVTTLSSARRSPRRSTSSPSSCSERPKKCHVPVNPRAHRDLADGISHSDSRVSSGLGGSRLGAGSARIRGRGSQ